jgi:hypothetical protein
LAGNQFQIKSDAVGDLRDIFKDISERNSEAGSEYGGDISGGKSGRAAPAAGSAASDRSAPSVDDGRKGGSSSNANNKFGATSQARSLQGRVEEGADAKKARRLAEENYGTQASPQDGFDYSEDVAVRMAERAGVRFPRREKVIQNS